MAKVSILVPKGASQSTPWHALPANLKSSLIIRKIKKYGGRCCKCNRQFSGHASYTNVPELKKMTYGQAVSYGAENFEIKINARLEARASMGLCLHCYREVQTCKQPTE